MPHHTTHLRIETGPLADGRSWTLAVSVHAPQIWRAAAPVLVCFAGGGYNRHYFDLQTGGYSEVAHHTARGVTVIAIDHLRTGESDVPELEYATLETLADANHAVLHILLQRLRAGTLADGIGAAAPACIIGEGQSMGGHIALIMQARHASFDALAILGSSVVCTRLPARISGEEICLLGRSDPSDAIAPMRHAHWRYAFHWEDVPEEFAGADAAALKGAGPRPYWRSATNPNAGGLMLPGIVAREAAGINVPVLLAMGERDVCQEPLRELAAFTSARDLSLFVCPQMAHMHNFAGTREKLWRRISAFIAQIAN